jgi:hypothetical protein
MWRKENSWRYRVSNSDPSVIQPVASRYTDWAILVFDVLQGNEQKMLKSQHNSDNCRSFIDLFYLKWVRRYNVVFWVMASYSMIGVYQRFGGIFVSIFRILYYLFFLWPALPFWHVQLPWFLFSLTIVLVHDLYVPPPLFAVTSHISNTSEDEG